MNRKLGNKWKSMIGHYLKISSKTTRAHQNISKICWHLIVCVMNLLYIPLSYTKQSYHFPDFKLYLFNLSLQCSIHNFFLEDKFWKFWDNRMTQFILNGRKQFSSMKTYCYCFSVANIFLLYTMRLSEAEASIRTSQLWAELH